MIGVAGIASAIPPLLDGRYVFGLLQILWFVWLGVVMLRTPMAERSRGRDSGHDHQPAPLQ